MFVVEAGAGFMAHSTALLADSLNMLGDSIVYVFSLYVLLRSKRWQAVSALLKGTAMAIFGFFVLGEAVYKILHPVFPVAKTIGGICGIRYHLSCSRRRRRATFFSGFGLGTLLMPVFAVFFPVEVAIGVKAIVHLANNVFKVFLVGRHANLKTVLLFAVPAAAVPGALLLNYFAAFPHLASYTLANKIIYSTPLKAVIAAVIIVFAVVELSPFFKCLSFDLKLIPLGGILPGFISGLSGHQGALRSAFLLCAGWKSAYRHHGHLGPHR